MQNTYLYTYTWVQVSVQWIWTLDLDPLHITPHFLSFNSWPTKYSNLGKMVHWHGQSLRTLHELSLLTNYNKSGCMYEIMGANFHCCAFPQPKTLDPQKPLFCHLLQEPLLIKETVVGPKVAILCGEHLQTSQRMLVEITNLTLFCYFVSHNGHVESIVIKNNYSNDWRSGWYALSTFRHVTKVTFLLLYCGALPVYCIFSLHISHITKINCGGYKSGRDILGSPILCINPFALIDRVWLNLEVLMTVVKSSKPPCNDKRVLAPLHVAWIRDMAWSQEESVKIVQSSYTSRQASVYQ